MRSYDWVLEAGKNYAQPGAQKKLLDETMTALFGRTEGTERSVLQESLEKAFVAGALLTV